MKNLTTKTAALALAVLLTFSTMTLAGEKENISSRITKNGIENLKTGIKSDNLGLRKSSIYFAGEYKIAEVLPELTSQLKKEDDSRTRILLALVIYKIGDADGISLVKKLAYKDSDPEVRRMCASIYNAYINDDAREIASITK